MWIANVLTASPAAFPGTLALSVIGRGLADGLWELNVHNIRDFALDRHGTIDDTPYGGGGGMVFRPDVLASAIEDVFLKTKKPMIYMSPRGKILNQGMVKGFVEAGGINILCGCFEGIDERAINEYTLLEVSVGDFVLSSGDVAAMLTLDACVRLLPGVLGNPDSLQEESFGAGPDYRMLLEYPHYTKPRSWKGRAVPDVLLSGNHAEINAWRLQQAEAKTRAVRPDLWSLYLKGKR